jgi:hypothetical protein
LEGKIWWLEKMQLRNRKPGQNLILPNLKKLPNFEFGSQSNGRFTKPPPSLGFEGAVRTRMRNRVKQRRCKLHGECLAR